ncbi:phenylalanine 4-monooxygenase [Gammaproteobacteria bacterium SCGC AG-212-F23]|nr:phenylalanine 4-monooxygenase [Gammaproteobacteria bacterium SCGC AG-212-F23]
MKYVSKQPDSNGFIAFTEEENQTWKILFERQIKVIEGRACDDFLIGLKKLDFPKDRVPQCAEVTAVLNACTGWSVVPVAAMIPLEEFYRLLANKQFPAASFIRLREDLDYLQEPDIFHEYFGHCPLLTNPAYADFVHWYGNIALSTNRKVQSILGRLFWFTIEFGLMQTSQGMRIYGGGILSSFGETIYALENKVPKRKKFDLIEVLNQPYRYDIMQDRYYFIENIEELFAIRKNEIVIMAERIANGTFDGNDFVIC